MAQGASITYQVTGVAPDIQYPAAGSPVFGKKVSFTMSTGYEGSVFVPDTVFGDAKAVHEAVTSQVRMVAAALAISGTITG